MTDSTSSPSPLRRDLAGLMLCAALGGVLGWFAHGALATRRSPTPMPDAAPAPSPIADALHAPPSSYQWEELPPAQFPIPPYARFLSGAVIVVDPGHVGQIDKGGDWKRGPSGMREAEANLRVALELEQFLLACGAQVTLTRRADQPLGIPDAEDLRDRAAIANGLRADALVSIHHNGAANPQTNYTSVFYHGSAAHSPASVALARHLAGGLHDALRLSQHIGCAVVTDFAIYRGQGFALLRHASTPAVLCESSFHSNPQEEARLRDPLYNRREAYGLFMGLARWAQAGLPRVALGESQRRSTLRTILLDDGVSERGGLGNGSVKIWEDSIVVRLAGQRLPFRADLPRGWLQVELPPELLARDPRLYVDFTTVTGQHVIHPWIDLSAPQTR